MTTKSIIACVFLWGICGGAAFADQTSPPAAPSANDQLSQNDRVKQLIDQLADEKFAVRDAASAELVKIGRDALPALKEALKSEDPNIKSYAEYLIGRIENPQSKASASDRFNNFRGLNGRGFNRGFGGNVVMFPDLHQRTVSISITDGVRRIDANEDGRHVVIDEGPDGIKMTVTESKGGKEVSTEYSAKSADELRTQSPQAWNDYQKYAAIDLPGVRARIAVPRVRNQPLDPNAIEQEIRARQLKMRQDLEDALRRANIPEIEVQRALDRLDRINGARPVQQSH